MKTEVVEKNFIFQNFNNYAFQNYKNYALKIKYLRLNYTFQNGANYVFQNHYNNVFIFYDWQDWRNVLFSLQAFGKVAFGPPEFRGIYQRQPTASGQIVRKLKLYEPTNPQTETQQAWRGVFADAVAAWQSLTDEEKKEYSDLHYPTRMSGYNRFISKYLKDNR